MSRLALLLGLALASASTTATAAPTHKSTCAQVQSESEYFLGLWRQIDNAAEATGLAAWSYLSNDAMYWALRDGEITWQAARTVMINRLTAHAGACVEVSR